MFKFLSDLMGIKWPFIMGYQEKKEVIRLSKQPQKQIAPSTTKSSL